MWSILTDSLSATRFIELCEFPENNDFKYNYYVKKYLYAIVLWEAIYKSGRRGFSRRILNQVIENHKYNKLMNRVKESILDLPHMSIVDEAAYIGNKFYEADKYMIGCDKESQDIIQDAIYYLMLGQLENMNILLSEQRAKFIEESGISKKIWSREDILTYLDKEVYEIYNEVYVSFGKEPFKVQTPLLIDYICKNATCLGDALDIAFQLREHKDIISFRETMNALDNAVDTGNILQVKEYKNSLAEIIDQFVNRDVQTSKLDVEITFTPSVIKPDFSAAFGIPINNTRKKNINMNFLLKLTRYGLEEVYRQKDY